ncbi:MAG: dihydrofolate reductase [Bacteroidota bacterium]
MSAEKSNPLSINLISAMSSTRVIGTQDGMPWEVPEEYQQYLGFVGGQTVIMGRRSYEIFGPDLTTTHNLVISRSLEAGPGYEVSRSLEEALESARNLGKKIFVAGGASIYAQALPLADQMYLSIIKGEFEGIAFFPEFERGNWEIVEQKDHPRFTFFRYRRKESR